MKYDECSRVKCEKEKKNKQVTSISISKDEEEEKASLTFDEHMRFNLWS